MLHEDMIDLFSAVHAFLTSIFTLLTTHTYDITMKNWSTWKYKETVTSARTFTSSRTLIVALHKPLEFLICAATYLMQAPKRLFPQAIEFKRIPLCFDSIIGTLNPS